MQNSFTRLSLATALLMGAAIPGFAQGVSATSPLPATPMVRPAITSVAPVLPATPAAPVQAIRPATPAPTVRPATPAHPAGAVQAPRPGASRATHGARHAHHVATPVRPVAVR